MRVFDAGSCTLLTSVPVFRAQVIHGIHCQSKPDAFESRCLVWGGRSIRIISLSSTNENHMKSNLECFFLIDELMVEDWLLDAFLLSVVGQGADDQELCLDAVFLTAHNVLYSLQLQVDIESAFSCKPFVAFLANGPSSVLYSAHVIVLGTGQILVACGTVFGKVLVWSCTLNAHLGHSGALRHTRLLQTFYGHEGSVFGVCIAELPIDTISSQLMWVIASCSDDRTIRVWKLANALNDADDQKSLETSVERTETGFGFSTSENSVRSTDCLAMAMGHSSRIWSLQFINCPESSCKLISFGEDSTCQLWNLIKESSGGEPLIYVLQKENVFGYHLGKNIWASRVRKGKDGLHAVLTGGADARIVTYNIYPLGTGSSREGIWRGKSQLSYLPTIPVPTQSSGSVTPRDIEGSAFSPTKQVFDALRGRWKIHRVLQSALSTSPSGVFKGMASYVLRSPTDLHYQGEYAYIEDGELSTETGLCIKGSRRYVYRYQEASDSITAWFVKTENESDVDYLFHEVKFRKPSTVSSDTAVSDAMSNLTAYGHHLCIKDHYTAEYIFHFRNRNLSNFSVKYIVKGPRKDYTADASYMRLLDEGQKHNPPTMLPEHNTDRKLTRIPSAAFHDDSFKCYCWIGPWDLVCSTAQGCIMHGILGSTSVPKEQALPDGQLQLQEISWDFIDYLPELRSYSIATGISGDAALIAGSCGTIFRYQASTRSVDTIVKLPRKVAGLFAEQISMSSYEYKDFTAIIASCIGGSDAYIFFLGADDKIVSKSFNLAKLKLPQNFVVTSARFVGREDVLVLGSRNGALAFYDCYSLRHNEFVGPSSCISHVHDEDAVTAIQEIPYGDADPSDFMLLSTGRDGKFCVHRIHVERRENLMGVAVETLHVAEPPFGPAIEGAVFDRTTKDLLLWGFQSTDFVVWNNTKQTEVMKVACGGSHRNWAYDPCNDGSDGGKFVWTKASVCNVHMQRQASHRVLQSGGHGREIKAVAITPVQIEVEGKDKYLIATGAEDTTIRISVVVEPQKHVPDVTRCMGLITKHNTGIQQLRWSADGRYLLSAGGCEEFYVWKIQPLPSLGIGVVCVLQAPRVTESLELRIMDFDVFAVQNGTAASSTVRFVVSIVYSDSTVRVSGSSIHKICA